MLTSLDQAAAKIVDARARLGRFVALVKCVVDLMSNSPQTLAYQPAIDLLTRALKESEE